MRTSTLNGYTNILMGRPVIYSILDFDLNNETIVRLIKDIKNFFTQGFINTTVNPAHVYPNADTTLNRLVIDDYYPAIPLLSIMYILREETSIDNVEVLTEESKKICEELFIASISQANGVPLKELGMIINATDTAFTVEGGIFIHKDNIPYVAYKILNREVIDISKVYTCILDSDALPSNALLHDADYTYVRDIFKIVTEFEINTITRKLQVDFVNTKVTEKIELPKTRTLVEKTELNGKLSALLTNVVASSLEEGSTETYTPKTKEFFTNRYWNKGMVGILKNIKEKWKKEEIPMPF